MKLLKIIFFLNFAFCFLIFAFFTPSPLPAGRQADPLPQGRGNERS
jgi:hypothetical protein